MLSFIKLFFFAVKQYYIFHKTQVAYFTINAYLIINNLIQYTENDQVF